MKDVFVFAFAGVLLCCGDFSAEDVNVEGDPSDSSVLGSDALAEEISPETASIDDGGKCGIGESGEYVLPCSFAADAGLSTLCNEKTHVCFAPSSACSKGMCFVPAASFQSGQSNDGLQVENTMSAGVTNVPRSFLIMETEVSLEKFESVMGYVPSNSPTSCPTCAVGGASIFEAMEFANRLSVSARLQTCYVLSECHDATAYTPPDIEYKTWVCERADFSGPSCSGFRLPSAAEWELSARAGSTNGLSGRPLRPDQYGCNESPSGGIDTRARYCANAGVEYSSCYDDEFFVACPVGPGPVGSTDRNAFGLFDTAGNVDEMTQTLCPREYGTPKFGPPYSSIDEGREFEGVFEANTYPCIAGGSWRNNLTQVCAHDMLAYNVITSNGIHFQSVGFRLVRTVDGSE